MRHAVNYFYHICIICTGCIKTRTNCKDGADRQSDKQTNRQKRHIKGDTYALQAKWITRKGTEKRNHFYIWSYTTPKRKHNKQNDYTQIMWSKKIDENPKMINVSNGPAEEKWLWVIETDLLYFLKYVSLPLPMNKLQLV